MITPQQIENLSLKIDGFVQLELGQHLPLVCLLADPEGDLAIFTNRKSDDEVLAILEAALESVRTEPPTDWKPLL
jgi:hypothetical protein